jgi:hypothetical protein
MPALVMCDPEIIVRNRRNVVAVVVGEAAWCDSPASSRGKDLTVPDASGLIIDLTYGNR